MMPEIEELILDFYMLKMKLGLSIEENEMLYNAPTLKCYRNDSLSYNRVISLLFKAELNKTLYNELSVKEQTGGIVENLLAIFGQEKKNDQHNNNEISDSDRIRCFLMADSIFCLTSAISLFSTIRSNTQFSNTQYSETFEAVAYWIEQKEGITDEKLKEELDKDLNTLLPMATLNTLKITYYRKMAQYYYNQAIEISNEGNAYQNMIERMYILDDDLQNNTSQFLLALERYNMNTGRIKQYETTNIIGLRAARRAVWSPVVLSPAAVGPTYYIG